MDPEAKGLRPKCFVKYTRVSIKGRPYKPHLAHFGETTMDATRQAKLPRGSGLKHTLAGHFQKHAFIQLHSLK